MTRRTFLLLTTTGIVGTALPTLTGCRNPVEYPSSVSQPQSIPQIRDSAQIDALGKAYLKKAPSEKDKRTLVRRLLTDAPSDSAAIPSFLEQKISQDFETGDTVMVNGWVLSRTEARQCALFSLEKSS